MEKKNSDINTDRWGSIVSLLHFGVKAGGLKLGMSASYSSCIRRSAKLILCAADLSSNSRGKIMRIAQECRVRTVLIGDKERFSKIFNRETTGIICIENVNIANGIVKLIEKAN